MLVNHVGITVGDLERSLAFYTEVVGFAVERRTGPSDAAWFGELVENPGAKVESVTLRLQGFALQLLTYHRGGAEGGAAGHSAAGNAHLCINVDGLDARYEQVRAAGHRVSPIVDIAGSGNRSFYVYDPDGVPVELLEPATGERWP